MGLGDTGEGINKTKVMVIKMLKFIFHHRGNMLNN